MNHRTNRISLSVVCLVCLVACSSMTVKKTSIWMNSMYNAQYAEYLTHFEKLPDGTYKTKAAVTDKQREILRVKKRIFTELYPLLEAYSIFASTGSSPKNFDMSLVEDRIVFLINRLVQLTVGDKETGNVGPSFDIDNPGRNSERSDPDSPNVGPN